MVDATERGSIPSNSGPVVGIVLHDIKSLFRLDPFGGSQNKNLRVKNILGLPPELRLQHAFDFGHDRSRNSHFNLSGYRHIEHEQRLPAEFQGGDIDIGIDGYAAHLTTVFLAGFSDCLLNDRLDLFVSLPASLEFSPLPEPL